MAKASIIIPTYNRAKFIKETIQSVLDQTFKDLEVIVVDDGSTDETKEIVEGLIREDNRIKYFYQKNCGRPSVPRNLGFKNSTGEYFSFLDSDDIWLPQKLEKQILLFENDRSGRLGFVDCGYIIIDEKGSEIKQYYAFHNHRGNIFNEFLKDNLILTPGSILIKRSVLDKVGLFDERFWCMDDWDMWLRISKYYDFDSVGEKLFKYRVHRNSVTVGLPQKIKKQDVLYVFEKNIENYRRSYPQKMKEAGVFYCETGNIKNGKKFLKEAIKINPMGYKAYFHYAFSLFGKNFYNFSILILIPILKIKRWALKRKGNNQNLRQKIFRDILKTNI